MNKVVFGVLCVCALLTFAFAEDATPESKVVPLNKDNFDEVIKSHKLTLVKFFATWCMHCKALASDYMKAAEILSRDGEDFILAEVNAEEQSELAEKYGVTGYPTLLLFTQDGEHEVFRGERDLDSLVSFMRVRLGIAVKILKNDAEIDHFLKRSAEALYIAYTQEDSEYAKVYKEVAEEMRGNFLFAVAPPSEKYTDKIVAYRDFEKEEREMIYDREGVPDPADLKQWLSVVSLPLAGQLTRKNQDRYKVLPTLVVYTHVDRVNDPAGLRYVLNRLRFVAKDYRFRMFFGVQERNSSDIYTFMKFPKDQKYAFAVLYNNSKFYRSSYRNTDPEKLTKEEVRAIAEQYFNGTLPRFFRSLPEPWFLHEGEVHTVVGTTFEGLIVNTSTDTFLEIFAPWCAHCKEFKPKWDELGSEMNVKGSTVRIAKIDATSNGLPEEYRYSGFPTFFWVPAHNGMHPIQYEGERKLGEMKKFIKKHRTENSQPYDMAPSRTIMEFGALAVGGILLGLVSTLLFLCLCKKNVSGPQGSPKPDDKKDAHEEQSKTKAKSPKKGKPKKE